MKQPRSTSKRSASTSARLLESAITIVAQEGMSSLSHRRLAQVANCSLALTTYYFPKKADIVSSISELILNDYLNAIDKAYDRYLCNQNVPADMWEYSARLISSSVAEKNYNRGVAWAEIYLDGIRRKESRKLSNSWVIKLHASFTKIANIVEPELDKKQIQSRIDVFVGLSFIAFSLALTPEQITLVLLDSQDPLVAWVPPKVTSQEPVKTAAKSRQSNKSKQTKAHILNAAISVVKKQGAYALTYAQLATETGLAGTAPSYHYPSITDLLQSAQVALFKAYKERYREATEPVYSKVETLEQLTDVTTFFLQREVQLFGEENLALYQLWIEAGRRPELRDMVWHSIEDQSRAWTRVFEGLLKPKKLTPDAHLGLVSQVLVTGKVIRLLSSGGLPSDLISVRSEFAKEFAAFEAGQYPTLNTG